MRSTKVTLAWVALWAAASLLLPDVATGQQWEMVAELPEARSGAASVELDGSIYVIGGRSHERRATATVFRYDVLADEWSDDDDMPDLESPRVNAAAVAVGRKIFVIGGRGPGGEVLQSVEVYDRDSNRWLDFPDTKRQREGAAAVVLRGEVYLIGGSDQGERALDTIELFDVAEDRWEEISEWRLDRARVSSAAAVVGTSVYVFGGFNTFGPVGQVQQFDATSGTVSSSEMRIARGALAAAVARQSVYLMGGRSQDRILDVTEIFHPDRASWSEAARLNVARFSHSAVTVGDSIYVIGGLGTQNEALSSVERLVAVGTASEEPELPPDLSMAHPFPNPFARNTRFEYTVASSVGGHVALEVVDVMGRRVKVLVDAPRTVGRHELVWTGDNDSGAQVASGVYFVRMRQGPFSIVRKVVRVAG